MNIHYTIAEHNKSLNTKTNILKKTQAGVMPKLHIFAGGSCLNNRFTNYFENHCISSQPVIPFKTFYLNYRNYYSKSKESNFTSVIKLKLDVLTIFIMIITNLFFFNTINTLFIYNQDTRGFTTILG